MSKKFAELVDSINSLTKSGALELEDKLFLQKALRDLGQAISVKDFKKVEKIVNNISKALLIKLG
ncbi:MAG: hypothetical protein WC059_04050 [Candidatus Paceibacterota bacterium]